MTRAIRLLGLLLALVAMAGCSTIRVRSDWDPTVEFSGFRRYHWVEPPRFEGANPFADNDLLRKHLRAAIERGLGDRGFQPVESAEEADFLVTWALTLEEALRVDGTSFGGTWGRHPYHGGFYSPARVRSYQESTLLIDFLDVEQRQLVWRGWASGVVRTRDRDRDQGRLESGVRRILDAFPPNR